MLKIKDNVDLKELEKFGFIYEPRHDWFKKNSMADPLEYLTVRGDSFHRIIGFYYDSLSTFFDGFCLSPGGCFTCEIFNVLYDLIEAGIVEKVEEQKK